MIRPKTERPVVMAQVHKRFSDEEVKALLEKYMKKEVKRKYTEEILGIKKRRLFELLKNYKEDQMVMAKYYTTNM